MQKKKKAKLVGINGRFTHSCLALFYVRNELSRNCPDLETDLLQFTINDNYYEMLLRLSNDAPDYIFFSAAIWNSEMVKKLARDLLLCCPSCYIIIGGPQAYVFRDDMPTAQCCIITGAIEVVPSSFFTDLLQGQLEDHYDGPFFSVSTPWYDFPYQEDDFQDQLKNRHIYYESSRGCPFNCTYCLSSVEKGIYHKDLEVVKDELRSILSHEPKIVRFIDRTFNDLPDRALVLWKFLINEGGSTLFHFEMAPDRFTEDMFSFLATVEPGKFQFEIGIQSTNPKTLEAVQRRVDPVVAAETVRRLAAFNNIHLHVDLILGLPYETKSSFAQSFRDIFAMQAHYIQMGLLKILPQTPISKSCTEYGYKYSNNPPYSVLENRWLNHRAMSQLYWFSECVEKFMNNRYFITLWHYLRITNDDVYLFFINLLEHCHMTHFFQFAATHELMCERLLEVCSKRTDVSIILELLRYDWLRCNHRFLPDCLKVEESGEQPQQTRSRLYQSMPVEMEGAYTKGTRNQFFRKSFFLRISKKTAAYIGVEVSEEMPCFCFLGMKDGGLYDFNKVLILNEKSMSC